MTPPTKPPTDNFPRVDRGGGWVSRGAAGLRAAARYTDAPAVGYRILGFRCAQRGCRKPVGKVTP